MRLLSLLAAVAAVATLLACSEKSESASQAATVTVSAPTGSASEPPLTGRTPQAGVTSGATAVVRQVSLTLRSDQREYPAGAPVQLNLRLDNVGSVIVPLTFPTGQRFDAEAVDSGGTVVWRWSDGKVFTQAVGTVVVDPGNSAGFDLTWDQLDRNGKRVPAGRYTIRAWLLSPGPQLQATSNITLQP